MNVSSRRLRSARESARRLVAVALLAPWMASSAWAAGNPGYDRPGLGFSPAVLPAGAVTWEQGLPDWSASHGASLYTADTLLRLGLGGPLEFQVGSSYNRASDGAQSAWGRGDTSVGLKFALPAAGAFSWGLLGTVEFTDGSRDFRGDDPAYVLGGVFGWQLNPTVSLGTYLEAARSGGQGSELVAVNAARALTATVGAYAEVAWQHVADDGNGSMAGAGLTWMATPRVQLDASFRHRLGGAADTWQAGFGVSVYFGRLVP